MRSLVLLLLLISFQIEAKSLSTIEDAQKLAESVMNDVGNGKMKEGLERLREYIVFPISEFEVQMNNIDMQIPIMRQRFGKSLDYDFVSEERVGTSLVQYVYLQKFERHVMVWRFIFYKPKNEWMLNTFYFNDQVRSLFRY